MWLQTRYGFFSIVCGTRQKGREVDYTCRLIRARNKDHLESLQEAFPDILGSTKILTNIDTDYGYRIVCGAKRVTRLVVALAEDIEYNNFKNEVAQARPKDQTYQRFLGSMWSNGLYMQPEGVGLYNQRYPGIDGADRLEYFDDVAEVPQVPTAARVGGA